MKFEAFYQKYFKNEKGDFYLFAKNGMRKMIKSIDPLHDYVHVENLLGLADQFLIRNKKIKNKIDLKAFFLAVCWHDVWKAQRLPKSILSVVYGQAAEGVLSSRLFRKNSKSYAVDKSIINKAAYAIRKHNPLQFTKRKTLEAKLLKDIDKLDSLNFDRFLHAWDENFRFIKKHHKFLINFYIKKLSRTDYNFGWTKDILKSRKREFIERFNNKVKHSK